MWPIIAGGFMLGFAGSLHCIGMCGPLALALPVQHLSAVRKTLSIFLYQFGRVFTYAVLGLLFGMVGRLVYIGGFQQSFSIWVGAFILIALAYFYLAKAKVQPAFLRRFNGRIQQLVIKILQAPKNSLSFLLLGMANGLLPCGMIYMGVAASLTSSGAGSSMLFMSMFGLGTMPAMIVVSYFGSTAGLALRRSIQNATPFIMALTAIVLILRGMSLGIPFISPILPTATAGAVHCH